MKIYHYKQLDSTQKKCQELYDELENWSIITAQTQTAGYGRTGLWDSDDVNIYMSIKAVDIELEKLLPLISVGLCTELNNHQINAYLKLPNDIYVNGRKLGGILIEPYLTGYIVGVGINVQSTKITGRTSLMNEQNDTWNINELIGQLQQTFINLEPLDKEEIMKMYQVVTTLKNQKIKIVDRKTQKSKWIKVNSLDTEKVYAEGSEYLIMQYKFNY